jgi:DNA-nicking Smr family endonuclease
VRLLSPDEARLWAQVTATIRPLSREKLAAPEADAPKAVETSGRAAAPARASNLRQARDVPPASAAQELHGRTLDGSWDKRLRSGTVEPDRVLDLHGMTLDSAWRAIDQALDRAIAAGDRILLLITGHERAGAPPVARGKIRAAVHDWLAASRHASRIASVRGAHRRHGGGGSLYIVLRRR